MEQTISKNAFLTQILVRNYLRCENKDATIHLYSELVNDIDSFTEDLRNMEMLKNKFKTLSTKTEPKTIDAFLTIIDEDSYTNSYDVKFKDELRFEDLLGITTKCEYPPNTQIQLIFVSSINRNKLTMTSMIEQFEKNKFALFNLSKEEQYLVVEDFMLNTKNRKLPLNDVFTIALDKVRKGKIVFKNKLTDEVFNIFSNNLRKCSIRELLLDELINTPISVETIREEYE